MQRSCLATLHLVGVATTALFLCLFLPIVKWTAAQASSAQQKDIQQNGLQQTGARQTGCATMDFPFEQAAPCVRLFFAGEVFSGQKFERKFSEKLMFRLNPTNASHGWTIEVVPETQDQPEEREYVWVVTPPYHFNNVRYLDTGYGTSAEEAVRESPRDFNFVLNEEQFKQASDLVTLAVVSHPLSDHRTQEELGKESDDAIRALKALSVSKGRLTILDSRVNAPANDKDLGSVQWLKFKIELRVPCAFATASGSDVTLDAGKCAHEGKKGKT